MLKMSHCIINIWTRIQLVTREQKKRIMKKVSILISTSWPHFSVNHSMCTFKYYFSRLFFNCSFKISIYIFSSFSATKPDHISWKMQKSPLYILFHHSSELSWFTWLSVFRLWILLNTENLQEEYEAKNKLNWINCNLSSASVLYEKKSVAGIVAAKKKNNLTCI